MKNYKILFVRLIILFFVLIQFLLIVPNTDFINISANAIDNDITEIGMEPIISAPIVNLTESIVVTYEDINAVDYELEYEADGIEAILIENQEYLSLRIMGIVDEEFGMLTVNAIANDGSTYSNVLHTYNSGTKLYLSEFSSDHALYLGLKDIYDSNTADNIFITEEECENKYAEFTSQYIESSEFIDWILEGTVTTVTGNVKWETSNVPAPGETDNPTSPMRNTLVQIGIKINDQFIPLASDYTDDQGNYSVNIDHSAVLDGADLYIRVKLEGHTFFLAKDWFFDHYFYEDDLAKHDITAGTIIQARQHTLRYDSISWLYKATYVHQAMAIGERFALEMGLDTSRIVRVAFPGGRLGEIDEELGELDGLLKDQGFCGGNIFNSSYSTIGIEAYNDIEMIVHEYSHYVQMSLDIYGATLIDIATYGPEHNPDIDLYSYKNNKKFAMHLTWSEGWGYAFSVMAQKYYENNYKPFWNLEYNTNISTPNNYTYKGEFQQQSIESFLWSLIDLSKVTCEDNKKQADEATTGENTEEAVLDYVLPWTPQEWWNMTTVSGTCRFPDFIELLENESYNLGVDIDYEMIKEYIAEKLMTYNIAPEIDNITFAQSNSREFPIITFVPNGSSSYPNNMISIRIMNSNGEILAETERVSINAGNLTEYVFGDDDDERAIMQAAWDIALEASPCSSSASNTTLKISVLGYRYDEKEENGTDIEEEFQLTGPYYSYYYEVSSVAIPHEYEYVRVDNDDHRMTCVDCGYSEVFGHVADPSYMDPTDRFAQCRYCGTLYRITGFTPIIRYNIPEEIAIE